MNQLVNTIEHIRDAWRAPANMRSLVALGRQENNGRQVVQRYAEWTQKHLRPIDDEAAVPVMLSAYNEQDGLPLCLLSLAQSEKPVAPIVIDNGSQDATSQIAVDMGATVWECPLRGKSNAIKMGLGRMAMLDREILLMTDADALLPPSWSRVLSAFKNAPGMERGGFVTSGTILYDRHKPCLQGAKTTVLALRDMRLINQGVTRTYGSSMCLFDGDQGLIRLVSEAYDERYVVGDDTQIGEIAADHGTYIFAIGNETRVYTRGNRISDWRSFWKTFDASRIIHESLRRLATANGRGRSAVLFTDH